MRRESMIFALAAASPAKGGLAYAGAALAPGRSRGLRRPQFLRNAAHLREVPR